MSDQDEPEKPEKIEDFEVIPPGRTGAGPMEDLVAALDQGMNAVLKEVIRVQLAIGDVQDTQKEVRDAIIEARDRAEQGRRNTQKLILDIIEEEVGYHLGNLRGLVQKAEQGQANPEEEAVAGRSDYLKDAIDRQVSHYKRVQEQQEQALQEALDPVRDVFAKIASRIQQQN